MSRSSTQDVPMSHEHKIQLLEKEFSNLDSAVVAAIYYDTLELDAARATLQILGAESAVDEADAGLPSNVDLLSIAGSEFTDNIATTLSSFSLSDATSRSSSGSGASWNDGFRARGFDAEKDSDDMIMLASMFPTMTKVTIQMALTRCGGDVERAIDELLNREMLEKEEGAAVKGVDAFYGDGTGTGKKGKRKGKKPQPFALSRFEVDGTGELDSSAVWGGQASNCWSRMSEEVVFVAKSLGLSEKTVSSAYHSHGSKLAPTVSYLLDIHTDETQVEDSEEHNAQLCELSEIFGKAVKPEYLDKLLRLCKDDKTAVFQLADVLSRYQPPSSNYPPPSVVTAPVSSSSSPSSSAPVSPRHPYPSLALPPASPRSPAPNRTPTESAWKTIPRSATSGTVYRSPNPLFNPSLNAASHSLQLRNESFRKASTAYKRSRSDRLMGGAAAYYADIGKIHDQHYKELDNRAAEEHVISQSSTDGGRLDLHGVTVQQAVKIAREWVTRWWVEARIKEERKGRVNMNQVKPLVIVTGQGRHSKDGEAKVGPAVGKMLDREGWRWRSEGGNTGVLMVYGVKGK